MFAFCCIVASRTTCKFLHPKNEHAMAKKHLWAWSTLTRSLNHYTHWYRSDLMCLHFDTGASWHLLKLPLEMFLSDMFFQDQSIFHYFPIVSLHYFPVFITFARSWVSKLPLPPLPALPARSYDGREWKSRLSQNLRRGAGPATSPKPSGRRRWHTEHRISWAKAFLGVVLLDIVRYCRILLDIVGLLEPQELSDQTSIWINVPKSDTPEKWTV